MNGGLSPGLPETRSIIIGYIDYRLNKRGHEWPLPRPVDFQSKDSSSLVQTTLRTMCDEYEAHYEDRLGKDMVTNIDNNFTEENVEDMFYATVNALFQAEGEMSWSRIVAFLAFCGTSCIQCLERTPPQPSLVNQITGLSVSYANTHLFSWIYRHGGWEGLISYRNQESSLLTRYGGYAAFIGAGLLVFGAYLTRRS